MNSELNNTAESYYVAALSSAYQLLESNEAACNAVLDILRTLFGDFNIVNNHNDICA